MPAIIKRIDAPGQGDVRQFAQRDVRPVEPDPAAIERARLIDDIARLEEASEVAKHTAEIAIEQARKDGRREGRADAEDRAAERLETLAKALDAITADIALRLDGLDRLAAALAKTALEKVFADPATSAELVAATIGRRVALLRSDIAVTLAVSTADFADTDSIEAMLRSRRDGCVTVTPSADLPVGGCRLVAGLDTITLDLPAQWHALAASLDAMVAA